MGTNGLATLKASLRSRDRPRPPDGEARKLYNCMMDKQPRVIARCVDAADVIRTVISAAKAACSLLFVAAITAPVSAVATTDS